MQQLAIKNEAAFWVRGASSLWARRNQGRVAGNALIYTLGTMLPQMMNVVLMPVLTRFVSPAEFGIFTYTSGICVFLGIFGSLSINTYVLRHYFDCRTEAERRALFGSIFAFLALWNVLLFGLELLLIPLILRMLHTQIPIYPYVPLALLNSAVDVLASIPLAYFRVREEAGKFVALTAMQLALNVCLTLYFVAFQHWGILGRYYGQLLANVAMLVAYIVIIRRIASFSIDIGLIRRGLAFSLPLVPGTIFFSMTSVSDRLILERFVPLTQLGLYGVGFSIAYALNGLVNGVNRAIEPPIYRAASDASINVRILHIKNVLLTAFAMLGCALIACSREIVAILLGPKYSASYEVVALVVMAPVLQGLTLPLAVYAMAMKVTRFLPRIYFLGASTSVASNLLLVPIWGIRGAAASSVLSSLVILLLFARETQRCQQLRWGLGRDLLTLSGAFLAGHTILRFSAPTPWASVAIKLCFLSLPLLALMKLSLKASSTEAWLAPV